MAASYFKEVFVEDPTLQPDNVLDCIETKVIDAINAILCAKFSEQEVADPLSQIGPLKAPGPDGFPGRFYQRNWSCLKEENPFFL